MMRFSLIFIKNFLKFTKVKLRRDKMSHGAWIPLPPKKKKKISKQKPLLFIYADSVQLRFANLVIKKRKRKRKRERFY